MAGIYLLDTNVVVAFLNGDAEVSRRVNEADEVFVPSITVGELYFGARKSTKVEQNVRRIDEVVRTRTVLPCDAEAAKHYGLIKNQLRATGHPIPDNDMPPHSRQRHLDRGHRAATRPHACHARRAFRRSERFANRSVVKQ